MSKADWSIIVCVAALVFTNVVWALHELLWHKGEHL